MGSLQLRAAVSAARGGRKAEAKDRIKHARSAAERMAEAAGPPIYDRHSLTFSPGNVQIHAISVALEMHEQREAQTRPMLRNWCPQSSR